MTRCPLCTHYRDASEYWQQMAALERARAERAEVQLQQLEQALFQLRRQLEAMKAERRLAR